MYRWVWVGYFVILQILSGCELLGNPFGKEDDTVTEVVSDQKLAELQDAIKEDIDKKALIRELGLEGIFSLDLSQTDGYTGTVDIDLRKNLTRDKEYLEGSQGKSDNENTAGDVPLDTSEEDSPELNISDLEELEKQVSETIQKFQQMEQHLNELEILIDEIDEHDKLDDDLSKLEELLKGN
jgi:hypothetical protein